MSPGSTVAQNHPQTYQMITSATQLALAADQINHVPKLAVDLEADSLHHYHEKVCLIQLATPSACWVVDPLSIDDLSPLKPIFASHKTVKVLHGADYDVRSLYRDFRIEISSLFDTELACRFLGMGASGLDSVLAARYDVQLVKKFRKRDWTQRPLPTEMIDYAVADVLYLINLAQSLEAELRQKNRLDWVAEECLLLSAVRPADNSHKPLFLNFRGAGTLDALSLTVLEELLELRHKIAARKDRPLFKVMANKSLLAIARVQPETLETLARCNALSPKQIQMYGERILAAVQNALAVPPNRRPTYPRQKAPRLRRQVPDRIKALKEWRDRTAAGLAIDPALILNRSMLTAIAVKNPRQTDELAAVDGIKNWQREAFGRQIIKTLAKV